jgi:hypothetical protein
VLAGQSFRRLGSVTAETSLKINSQGATLFDLPMTELVPAWNTPLQPA